MHTSDKALSAISGILDTTFNAIASLFPEERKTKFDSDFMPSSTILSTWNKGYCVTGTKSLTIQDSYKNVLVTGITGNFKSSGILLPSIYKMRGHASLVINDPSGELFLKSSGALNRC